MKIFISWSGVLSHAVAEHFRLWLPSALQAVRPYFTPSDIEKGDRWSNEISKELEACDVGVLFVTKENISSTWMLYEAGALSKRLEKGKVCPVLVGILPGELPGPLRQFQATELNEKDFRKLFKTINSSVNADIRVSDAIADNSFEMWWPKLKLNIDAVVEQHSSTNQDLPVNVERKMLEEILELSRLNASRAARGLVISPAAIEDLCSSLISVHDSLNTLIDADKAMEALKNTIKPIQYLARRADHLGREELEAMPTFAKFKDLSFTTDDIPF